MTQLVLYHFFDHFTVLMLRRRVQVAARVETPSDCVSGERHTFRPPKITE